jgi:hypothetical protein
MGCLSLPTAFGQRPSQDNRGDPSRIELFQAQMIQSNELTLPGAACFPNDKKGSDQRSPAFSVKQMISRIRFAFPGKARPKQSG